MTIRHATLTSELAGAKIGAAEWDAPHDIDLEISDIAGLQAALDATGSPFRGCLGKILAGHYVGATFTGAGQDIEWADTPAYDTDGIIGANGDDWELVVPSGVTRIKVGGFLKLANMTGDTWMRLSIRKNYSSAYHGYTQQSTEIGNTGPAASVWGPVLPVVAGDVFTLHLVVESDIVVDLDPAVCWGAMEIVA